MNKIDGSIYENFTPLPYDASGWGGDSPIFKRLIKEIRPRNIIEVGSWKGQSSITMGKAVKSLGLDTKIYCIDTWLGSIEFWCKMASNTHTDLKQKHGYPQIYYQFLSNVVHNNLEDVIFPLPMTSLTGSKYLKVKSIISELIYIDASHEEEDVYSDILSYWPLLDNEGIMFGDDFNKSGVRNAVKRTEKKLGVKFQTDERFWILKKKAKLNPLFDI